MLAAALLAGLFCASAAPAQVHHYVFFNRSRERIHEKTFLETKAVAGAQLKYTWRELEPKKDDYDFSAIRDDLAFLTARGKKLFIQLQDVSFDSSIVNVPPYLLSDSQYHGGANRQQDEEEATGGGWVARRWDPAVQKQFHKLLVALGQEFDGRIEGINLPETAVGFGGSGRGLPEGFSFDIYRDAVILNMRALKRAFPRSVAMQYANFMPGEWLPGDDKGYLRAVYKAAIELHVGVGGPDLLPYRRGQLNHAYPLIRGAAGSVPTGIAVQDGNYKHENPQTGMRVTIAELAGFARDYLEVDYVFWGTEEPYYTEAVIPYLKRLAQHDR